MMSMIMILLGMLVPLMVFGSGIVVGYLAGKGKPVWMIALAAACGLLLLLAPTLIGVAYFLMQPDIKF